VPNPAIVLVSDTHTEAMLAAFPRYTAEYDVRSARSCAEALEVARAVQAEGGTVALFVSDTSLPDVDHVLRAFGEWRTVMPTARRMILAPWERFLVDGPGLRSGMAKGKYDAYQLLPRGVRDEEFHAAVTDLLSDWGATVPDPEVVSVKIVTPERDALTHAIRDFLGRLGMPVGVYDPDSEVGLAVRAVWDDQHPGEDPAEAGYPLLWAPGGTVLRPTSTRDVARQVLVSPAELPVSGVCDLAVVGAGPAGLAAAVYGASEGLSVVVLESEAVGGQAGTSSMIRNYLGFPRGVSGMRLAQRARSQALRFGARFQSGREVLELVPGRDGEPHLLRTDDGDYAARTVVVSTGVAYRKLRVEPLEELVGRGVHYGAAMTAAREMEGYDVYVVGGGNSAGQAAVHLARFARSVTILVRRTSLAETMSDYLVGEIDYNPRIEVRTCTQVVDGGGEGRLGWLCLEDTRTGERERVEAQGLFLLLGAEPHCDWLPEQVVRDPRGFVLTGRDVPRDRWDGDLPPHDLATTVPGVFAAGDIHSGSMKRVAAASGEGASVVPLVHAFLAPEPDPAGA
jgi:thioredoxin reductase (NADPH)